MIVMHQLLVDAEKNSIVQVYDFKWKCFHLLEAVNLDYFYPFNSNIKLII